MVPLTTYAVTTGNTCYIATTECPANYLEYASENASRFILSLDEKLDSATVSVGMPFAFADDGADVYYFPILCEGHIKYLFRIYPDGNSFSAAITQFLADDIDSLAYLTSVENPLYLNRVDTKIVATIGSNSYELYQYPESMSDGQELVRCASTTEYIIKDIKSSSDIELNLRQARDIYEYINLSITETQSHSDNWCTAYCLAAIIRTKTQFTTTAKELMNMALGSASQSNTFPWVSDNGAAMTSVPSQFGLHPTVLLTTTSNEVLIQELGAKRPCIIGMKCSKGKHAVVLRGWSSLGTWSIWDPYFNYYQNYSISGAYVMPGYSSEYSFYPYLHAYNYG